MRSIFVLAALAASPILAEENPTYCRDIAPILNQNCVTCHRPGEVAPFSLGTYADAKKHGRLMAEIVKARIMPPWKPIAGYGEFLGERRLTDEQINLIQKWVKTGMPEGNQKDLPESPQFPTGWQIGTPDIVVTMPEAYQIPAEGRDIHRNFVLPLEVPEGKYIRAIELQPSNRRVVHHAVIVMDRTQSARKKDEADPGPGFTQVLLPGQMLPGNMGVWIPGWKPLPMPESFALRWPKNADLVLQLHLHPSGKPESEQSKIAIYLTDQKPSQQTMDVFLEEKKIDIPPGEKAYHTRDYLFLPVNVNLMGLLPHMHWLGKEVKITAHLPTGETQVLLWINDWDFKWQMYYQYKQPVPLPAGTEIVMECIHDNSVDNPNNPSLPPQRVHYGEQTFDEMSVVVVQLLLANEADRLEMHDYMAERRYQRAASEKPRLDPLSEQPESPDR